MQDIITKKSLMLGRIFEKEDLEMLSLIDTEKYLTIDIEIIEKFLDKKQINIETAYDLSKDHAVRFMELSNIYAKKEMEDGYKRNGR